MLPIGDNNPTRTTPTVNLALLIANLLAFALQQWLSRDGGAAWVVPGYGLVPTRLLYDPPGEAFTLFTSMFMHGGIAHLVGNLLFLHIFGDNVEDAMGHVRYLVFYLTCGVAAGLVQVAIGPHSMVPMVGRDRGRARRLHGALPVRAHQTSELPAALVFSGFVHRASGVARHGHVVLVEPDERRRTARQ
jgi:membrane associated rhomboid family serine protease